VIVSFPVCVDASVALKLVLDESDDDLAEGLWFHWQSIGAVVIAPYHFAFETTSVIRGRVYRGLLTAEMGRRALAILQAQRIQLYHPPEIIERAWGFAERFKRPTVYDSFYLALSELTDCDLWTADRRLYNVVRHDLPWVKWLGDYRPAL
jgi:predicted nucleic acid-binding protein